MQRSKMFGVFAAALVATVLTVGPAFAKESPVNAKGTIVDVMCGADMTSQADADAHTKKCALSGRCASSGFGAVIDGKFHKFDAAGNKQAEALLTASKKNDHITATVEGTMLDDGSIKVTKITADE